MPRHIGTCFRFYTQMRVEKKTKHLPIKFIVTSHNSVHCCYLRASVGIAMAILPLEGIYPQIKRAKVLFKTKTNNLPLICNSIFETGRQCLLNLRAVPSK